LGSEGAATKGVSDAASAALAGAERQLGEGDPARLAGDDRAARDRQSLGFEGVMPEDRRLDTALATAPAVSEREAAECEGGGRGSALPDPPAKHRIHSPVTDFSAKEPLSSPPSASPRQKKGRGGAGAKKEGPEISNDSGGGESRTVINGEATPAKGNGGQKAEMPKQEARREPSRGSDRPAVTSSNDPPPDPPPSP
jgi:hypothetical protein